MGRALPPECQAESLQRLRSVEGHLHAVVRMIATGKPCEIVLHQLDAVRTAVEVSEVRIIWHLVQQNIAILQDLPCEHDQNETVEELSKLFQILERTRSVIREVEE